MTVEVYNIHLTATLQKYVLIVIMGKVDQHYYNYKYKSPFVNIDSIDFRKSVSTFRFQIACCNKRL